MTGSTSKVINLPLPQDDPRRRRPDIGRAKALLGWEPKVGLQEGLEATVGWFSDERHRTALFSGRIGEEVGRADLIAAE
jgi:UDP-glucuronate decarboxylase